MRSSALWLLGKRLMRPFIYRYPPVMMSPTSLFVWFEALAATNDLDGAVVEVGCYLGGTAAMSARMLKNMKSPRHYFVVDTFSGFVEEQLEAEMKAGGARFLQTAFANNSEDLTRYVLDKHGGDDVRMIKGDIGALADADLPEVISACLLDVDLVDTIYFALKKTYPRLAPGGVIVVDDCDDGTFYKARIGYERFMREHGLEPDYRFGAGLLRKPVGEPNDATQSSLDRLEAANDRVPAEVG